MFVIIIPRIDRSDRVISVTGSIVMSTFLLFCSLGSLLLVGGLIARSIQANPRGYQLDPETATEDGPLVSIIVPARNEGGSLPECLPTILSQTYENFEVIAVDDRSTDNTRQVLEEFDDERLTIVDGRERPDEGWTGKTWAVHQGVQQARGDYLLFTDADMKWAPWLLGAVMADFDREERQLYSILPQAQCERWWNKLLLPLHGLAIFLAFPISAVNDPDSKTAIAVGGFMLISRSFYEETGGHRHVRERIAEDLAMAQRVKEIGGQIRLKSSEGLNSDYYRSPGELIDGMAKHIIASPVSTVLTVPIGLSLFGLFVVVPAVTAVVPDLAGPVATWSSRLSIGLLHLIFTGLHVELDHSPLWGLLAGPATVLYAGVGLYSLYHELRHGGPSWKGRRIRS
jgi:chlorobactene glucosyltransferase